jgi:SAM-dependent methyltransferase
MNRQQRRANRRQESHSFGVGSPAGAADTIGLAASHLAQGRPHEALRLLKTVLVREPGHAAAHAGIAMAYRSLKRRDAAERHFDQAISLNLPGVAALVTQNPAMVAAINRFAESRSRHPALDELLGADNGMADDGCLLALLRLRIICDLEVEVLLTAIRRELLVAVAGEKSSALGGPAFGFACALAHQCFLNEYVYAVGNAECGLVARLNDRVVEAGAGAAPADLAVLGCYLALHRIPVAARIGERRCSEPFDALITRQVREPLAEAAAIAAIPALTAIEDETSRVVQRQYEENPYPRWSIVLPTVPTTLAIHLRERFGLADAAGGDILIAGCGTGEQSINTAQTFPQSKLLAVDISRTSLAYALRKSRELGIKNIEYARADILKLGSLGRRFDYIESVGVLHHMSDPEAGWRVLRALLRPGGVMRIGLYSELARKPLASARALIAERGYRPTVEDIRTWRQELIRRDDPVIVSSDFFCASGCRDLCFNVMEHRFTLPRIKQFLEANRLTLLDLDPPSQTSRQQFMQEYPQPCARTDLDCWQAFEEAHPRTFHDLYYVWLRDDTFEP